MRKADFEDEEDRNPDDFTGVSELASDTFQARAVLFGQFLGSKTFKRRELAARYVDWMRLKANKWKLSYTQADGKIKKLNLNFPASIAKTRAMKKADFEEEESSSDESSSSEESSSSSEESSAEELEFGPPTGVGSAGRLRLKCWRPDGSTGP